MPRGTEFSVAPGQVAASAETVKGLKSEVDQLAASLTDIQKSIKGSSGAAVQAIADVVKKIQEQMYEEGRRVGLTGEIAAWSAIRYQNAERIIMGQEPVHQDDAPGGGGSGGGGSDVTPGPGPDGKPDEGGDGKPPKPQDGWYDDVDKSKDWERKAWTWKRQTEKDYGSAKKEYYWDEKEGKWKDRIVEYTGLTQRSKSITILNVTKRNTSPSSSLGGFTRDLNKSLNEKYGYNKFKKADKNETWHRRAYESDPDNPNIKDFERVDDDHYLDNTFSQDLIGAELVHVEANLKATLWGADKRAEGKYGSAGVGAEVLTAEVHASAGAGVYYVEKNGKRVLAVGASAEVGGSATILHTYADASAYVKASGDAAEWLGEDFQFIGAKGEADIKVGHVEAQAGAKCRWIDGQPEIAVEGSVGAYALKASAKGSVTALGITASAKAEVNIGIGATAKIGYTGGKLRCELGASLGIGFKISFDLDISGAVNAVKNVATKVAGYVAEGAKKVGKAIKKVFSGW